MNSMTGFGSASTGVGPFELRVEASSVNKRGLEVSVSLPREWQGLERIVNGVVREQVERGKVHVAVRIEASGPSDPFDWDNEAVGDTLRKLEGLARARQMSFEPDAATLLQVASLHRMAGKLPEEEAAPKIKELLTEALQAMNTMRLQEGSALAADLRERVNTLRGLVKKITEESKEAVGDYRDALLARLQQLGLDIDLSDERVLREIALFADKSDIAEELTRLDSHLQQFLAIVDDPQGRAGRKLEFLVQEIHREVNTIGSKTTRLPVTQHVLEAKNEIERIREQLANVE